MIILEIGIGLGLAYLSHALTEKQDRILFEVSELKTRVSAIEQQLIRF